MDPIEIHSFDWSGAGSHAQPQPGIVLCRGRPGAVPAIESCWSRASVFGHLCALASRAPYDGTILAGLDFSHSFPFATKGKTFPDGSTSRAEFWAAVHGKVWTANAQCYIDAHRQHFLWYDQVTKRQHTGTEYVPARRVTEQAAGKAGALANTVFKLVGSNQVGKGSLCGIALLETLRRHCREKKLPLVVWPLFALDASGSGRSLHASTLAESCSGACLVVVESYPSLYWARAGFIGRRPWDDPAAWPRVRERFAACEADMELSTGDEGDALIAWYALADPCSYSTAPSGDSTTIREEGWIFGADLPA